MSLSPKKKLDRLEKAFINFFDDPKIAGTIDEFYGHEEEYRGLWVSAENGNFVPGTEQTISAWDYWRWDYVNDCESPDQIHPVAQKWLDDHGCYLEWHDAGTAFIVFDDDLYIESHTEED